jgi:hypothetical protein
LHVKFYRWTVAREYSTLTLITSLPSIIQALLLQKLLKGKQGWRYLTYRAKYLWWATFEEDIFLFTIFVEPEISSITGGSLVCFYSTDVGRHFSL